MSIMIKNGYILTLNGRGDIYESGDVLIDGDRIVAVDSRIDAIGVDQTIDAKDKLVMPGFNIAHAHSWAQLFKGAVDGGPLEIWILDNLAPPNGWPFNSRQLYLRTILGAVEMIRNGATTVWDDLLLTQNNQQNIFSAYQDVGMRAVITAAMYDKKHPERTLFLKDVLPQSLLTPLMKEIVRSPDEWMDISEAIISKWHGVDGRLYFAVSVNWVQGSSNELILKAANLSQKYNLPLVTHALETKIQQVTGEVFYGDTIIKHLEELGVLTPRTSIVHGVWITDEDICLLANAGASVLHNPSSNLTLGSGLMPFRKLKEAGVNIALGVDEGYQSKWNPFEMMKMAALVHKISTPDYRQWPTSGEVLDMATRGGARSELIHHEVGSIEVGMKADVIIVDINNSNFMPLNNIKNQLVYCESGDSVVTSIINGKIIMQDRKFLTVDLEAILDEATRVMPNYWKNQEENNALELSHKIRPYTEEIYRRVTKIPTGINRWIGDEKDWVQ